MERLPFLRYVVLHIRHRDQAVMALHVGSDESRSLPLVEFIGSKLLQPRQRRCQVRLFEELALFEKISIVEKDSFAVFISAKKLVVAAQISCVRVTERKTVSR